jgi:murein L,D-transpeptidase YcbB/YkuD
MERLSQRTVARRLVNSPYFPIVVGVLALNMFIWASGGRPRPSLGAEQPRADSTVVARAIRTILDDSAPPPRRPAAFAEVREALGLLYSPDTAPVWTAGGRPRPGARQAVALLKSSGDHGLEPRDYDAAWLEERLSALDGTLTPVAEDLAAFDATLSVEVLRFLRAVHVGRVKPAVAGFAYHVDTHGADLADGVKRAAVEGRVNRLVAEREPAFAQYRRLKLALARYRDLAGTGQASPARVRQIELALERLRWLPHPPPGPLLIANVPAFRLVAFRSPSDERPVLQMGIVVGRAARTQTPLFAGELRQVIFRPAWYPPASIVRNEILPALGRDPTYLARQSMELVAAGHDASPALAPTAENLVRLRAGRVAVRQRPGPGNALGLVKFVFPNEHRVYMHDTPAKALFARERRDFSHGCIRVERPVELAEFVLSRPPGVWTPRGIRAAMNGARTLGVDVVPPIPVLIYYTTAIVRADGAVEFFDDVYGLDAALDRALGKELSTALELPASSDRPR